MKIKKMAGILLMVGILIWVLVFLVSVFGIAWNYNSGNIAGIIVWGFILCNNSLLGIIALLWKQGASDG